MANELSKPNKITVGGGLHSRLKAAEVLKEIAPRVDPRSMPNRLAIIADFSGSMGELSSGPKYETFKDDNRKSKLDLLKEAVQDFAIRSNPADTAIAVESFPHGFRINLTTDNNEVYLKMMNIQTLGDTPMGEGLQNALEHHTPTRALLISDGEQTDGERCFNIAETYKRSSIVVDTVHIGDSTRGEETLRRIAEITGGMFLKFKDVTSFASNFHWLLPEARAQLAGMLPYEVSKLLGADEVK